MLTGITLTRIMLDGTTRDGTTCDHTTCDRVLTADRLTYLPRGTVHGASGCRSPPCVCPAAACMLSHGRMHPFCVCKPVCDGQMVAAALLRALCCEHGVVL